MITSEELKLLHGLLEALFRKCKSDGLREPTLRGIAIVKRERDEIQREVDSYSILKNRMEIAND